MSTEVVSAGDVMEFIKARIRAGAFVAGQRLVETDLMQMTGATRSRLREALRAVAYEGLIELHEFKGAVVRGLTHEDARQMWELREVLEGAAARICEPPRLSRRLLHLRRKWSHEEEVTEVFA